MKSVGVSHSSKIDTSQVVFSWRLNFGLSNIHIVQISIKGSMKLEKISFEIKVCLMDDVNKVSDSDSFEID